MSTLSTLFREWDEAWTPHVFTKTYAPACDIRETKDQFEVVLDIPGVNKEDVQIEVTDQHYAPHLVVKGERDTAMEEKSENAAEEKGREGWHVTERPTGHFERSFRLPQGVNTDRIAASYENGVLRLIIPKAEERKARLIQVQ